jgi:phenylpropionate dioxygenase-like ring-hydroxylating dioxygenase large terminal subunit
MWHVIASIEELDSVDVGHTCLLGDPIAFARAANGEAVVWRTSTAPTAIPDDPHHLLLTQERYGYLWTSLGRPKRDLFEIPEYDEADRRTIHAATIGVKVSAPRAVENFLDMGHFPYVHTGILGAEPHTEVKDYNVALNADDEIIATDCKFWQPMAAPGSMGGADVDYVYRVPHPYCSLLYKSSPGTTRMDVIAAFIQPIDEENIRAHMMLAMIDTVTNDTAMRLFQQTIFAQDKPSLDNQPPKRLPLDPRAETPIRADKSAIFYRRWLTKMGITYGVIPTE